MALTWSSLGCGPIQATWDTWIRRDVQRAMDREDEQNRKGNHVFLTIKPHLMTGQWTKKRHPLDTSPTLLGVAAVRSPRGSNNIETFLDWAVEKREWRCVVGSDSRP